MNHRSFASAAVACAALGMTAALALPGTAVERQNASRKPSITLVEAPAPAAVPRFGKVEIGFRVDTAATMLHWPYDPEPPAGVPEGAGITVAGEFVDPRGREYSQPAFQYQHFEQAVRNNRDWHYPTPRFVWRVRFSPNETGTWKYRLVARDRNGSAATQWSTFTVADSPGRGFVRVSRADSRYFEFDDGTWFSGLGFQFPEHLENPDTAGARAYRQLGAHGVNFVRLWITTLYGSAWPPYIGGRNRYDGYLPVAGLMPHRDPRSGEATLTMRMAYRPGGNGGWFDPCRVQWSNDTEAVKPGTRYRVSAVYRGMNIEGPRLFRSPRFGFVVKLGGMFTSCHNPGTSRPVTGYGLDTAGWSEVEGVWFSGQRHFLPKLHLALENVSRGAAHVRSVSMREMLPDGTLGPEILARPSMEYHLAIPQARAFALDRIVEQAERNGVYLKLVVMEKDDEIYKKMADDGGYVTDRDNRDGVYGLGRKMNRTRWLQQAWWRYLQARWGYSPNIHSWELVNEGDPASQKHYEAADEFGKFMHYGVFGRTPDPSFDHPNDHLVTTSFWHSFPAAEFWGNPRYPHVDYADLHAYVSTSPAPGPEKARMQGDAAYYHMWHSQTAIAARLGKPVVRGEAGLDAPGRQDERALGLQRDRTGVWLHNFLWAGLDAGGLYELYWWRSHIWGAHADHRTAYRRIARFLAGLPLNKGGYVPWDGTVTNQALRVVGQKHARAGRLHLWIQNTSHTWKNVVDARPIEPVSGDVHIPGFSPRTPYDVEWWDTWAAEGGVEHTQVVSDGSGRLTLEVRGLRNDVAVKVQPAGGHRRES